MLAASSCAVAVRALGGCALGGRDRKSGDFDLGVPRASCEFFNRVPIAIAGREIHRGEVAACAQHRVYVTDALEELGPIDGGHEAHARDHVAYGHVHRALPVMLGADDLVGRRSLGQQPSVQPQQRRRHLGILIAQALNQLDREGPRQRRLFEAFKGRFGGLCFAAANSQQPVGQNVGLLSRRSAAHDALGGAPQIFHQNDSERNRNRPELTDRQRLHTLVGLHESAERLRVEPAVGVRDEGPGDAEYARIALEWPVGKFRQLTVEAAREVVADFANLFLDYMKVVDQPLGRGRDGAFLADCDGDGAIRFEQDPAVFPQPCRQPSSGGRPRRDRLRSSEALGMLLEALDAEQFRADRLFGVRGKSGGRSLQSAKEHKIHTCLSIP